jgi:serine/threonine-protein kinase/endoribonuclease IRE1
LCDASLDRLFLKENDPKKYRCSMPPQTEVLLQLAKGLEYIHQMKYVHRDIKPENVLISLDSTTQRVVMKWADFGFSKQVNERGTYTMKSGVKGTYDYFAPEILKLLDEDQIANDNEAKKRGTVKSDVFAEGLVFGYFLLGGVHPFGTLSHQIQNNLRTNEPTNLPGKSIIRKPINNNTRNFFFDFRSTEKKEFRNIIIKMLNKKPDNRISSSDAVNLLLNFMQTTVKKVIKLCLNYY